ARLVRPTTDVPLGQPYRLPLRSRPGSGRPAECLATSSVPACLFTTQFRLPHGEPGDLAGRDPSAAALGQSTVAQVDEVRAEQGEAGCRPDPETRPEQPHTAQPDQ